jgi:hypothetical protein
MDDDEIAIDVTNETIRLFGISYTLDMFRMLAFSEIGTRLRIEAREDGIITLLVIPPGDIDAPG